MTEPIPIIAVQRVREGHRSWIEPGLKLDWPPRRQAAWHVAVLQEDIGLDVKLHAGTRDGMRDTYSITVVGVSSSGPYSLYDLPIYLHGIRVGVEATQRGQQL